MDLKNRIPCAIMNQGKSMLIDKTSILSQNLGHNLNIQMYMAVNNIIGDTDDTFM